MLNHEILRLHRVWERWDLFARTWGEAPDELAQLDAFKSSILERIGQTRMKPENKEKWRAKVEAACGPQPKRTRTSSHVTRTEALSISQQCPLWSGPNGDGPLRRVVGVVWCRKVSRWAIRIQTRQGEYINTNTQGIPPDRLAFEVDHMKVMLMLRGYFSPRDGMRHTAFNDWETAKDMLESGSDISPDLDNPLHSHLYGWMKRVSYRDALNANAARSGRFACTLHAFRPGSVNDLDIS